MNTFQFVSLFYFLTLRNGILTIDISISSSHKSAIKLGEKVVITCKLSSSTINSPVPLLFFNKEEMISEGCSVFKKDLYNLQCKDKEYKLEIKKISFDAKGQWKCQFNEQITSLELDVYIPNNVSISINPIFKLVSSSNLGPNFFLSRHESYTALQGLGIQSNPYDLRKNLTVNIVCNSDCGYPLAHHMFNFTNSSNFSLELHNKSFKYERTICDADRNTSSARSILKFNCLALKLRGLINLTCASFHTYSKDLNLRISEGNVFILCPTDTVKWWEMTYGEMINTIIGCMIGVMLLMFLCLMICRWKSSKHKNNYDSCQEENGDSKLGRGYKV